MSHIPGHVIESPESFGIIELCIEKDNKLEPTGFLIFLFADTEVIEKIKTNENTGLKEIGFHYQKFKLRDKTEFIIAYDAVPWKNHQDAEKKIFELINSDPADKSAAKAANGKLERLDDQIIEKYKKDLPDYEIVLEQTIKFKKTNEYIENKGKEPSEIINEIKKTMQAPHKAKIFE